MYQWISSFFGLKPSHKKDIHQQIFQIVYGSEGAFDFTAIYTMPVYLKHFYFKLLADQKDKENKKMKQMRQKTQKAGKP